MIGHLSIKARLLGFTTLSLILLASIAFLLVFQRMTSLTEYGVDASRDLLLESRKTELKHILETAYSDIRRLHEEGAPREQAIERLRHVKYGEDGYIFGYDSKAVRVFSGDSDANLGKSYYDYQDVNGVYLIRVLVEAGKKNELGRGNNFVEYHFPRINGEEASPKLSYALYLEKWDLMIGTGVYIDRIDTEIGALQSDMITFHNSLLLQLFILTSLITTVFVVLSVLLTRSIVSPLTNATESIKALCTGNGDLSQRLIISGTHELGRLSFYVNKLLETLGGMIGHLKQIAISISAESDQLAEQTNSMMTISIDQDKEVDQIATAVTEMSQSTREVASNAEQAAAAAKTADTSGREATKNIEDSFEEMAKLGREIDNASNVIAKVGESVNDISGVLQVIESIAEQTNLLALNAAIEAARAGEQGRGFAVVADEVRTLASKTQGSTDEIQQMIGNLQKAAATAVEVMQVSASTSQSTDVSFHKTAEALNGIIASVSAISDMNVQIAVAVDQQTAVGEHISHRVTEISSKANQGKDIASLNNQTVTVLSDKVSQLNDIIAKFKLS
ncbi:methyl-accepting chemotaxis protein [Alteromonadaceae bacterium Bs31]|nr:methyl-accepting chemotaxis protein [Alteromonadaceae bacterium Bs31]